MAIQMKLIRSAQLPLLLLLLIVPGCRSQVVPKFDSRNAFQYLVKQCEFGPRVPGTPSHLSCRDYLMSTLQSYADRVMQQPFQAMMGPDQKRVSCYNIIANFQMNNPRRVLLCAHWDTRPWADLDPDPANRKKPVPGANDGASGVAILLEIARILKLSPPKYGVDIVLFDAEDFGSYGRNDTWALGSKQFASQVVRNFRPEFGILLDMVGDADQQIYIEQNSHRFARPVVERVWRKADQLGISEFIPEIKFDVYDDHLNLLEIGIPTIDIIDFDYKYWHTIEDTPDKCSPKSLENVGRVVLGVIYE